MAAYLKLDAIKKGESKAKGHEGSKGWIEVGSIQFGAGRSISTPVGMSSKREASAPNVSEITMTKLMDSTSPLIYQEVLRGVATKGHIDLVETHEDQLETYLMLTLDNCMVSSYTTSSAGDRPTESFSLNFTKIEYKYTPYDDKHKAGTPVPVTYDLTTATK
jgi:type VI secretion system secreted protein Hcp